MKKAMQTAPTPANSKRKFSWETAGKSDSYMLRHKVRSLFKSYINITKGMKMKAEGLAEYRVISKHMLGPGFYAQHHKRKDQNVRDKNY